MSIFGIKKNEHGGGSLVQVEGGTGGNGGLPVLYCYFADGATSDFRICHELNSEGNEGNPETALTANELKEICEAGGFLVKSGGSYLFPTDVTFIDNNGVVYGQVHLLNYNGNTYSTVIYTTEYVGGGR